MVVCGDMATECTESKEVEDATVSDPVDELSEFEGSTIWAEAKEVARASAARSMVECVLIVMIRR